MLEDTNMLQQHIMLCLAKWSLADNPAAVNVASKWVSTLAVGMLPQRYCTSLVKQHAESVLIGVLSDVDRCTIAYLTCAL